MPAAVARITAPIVIISAGADREVSPAQADALAHDAGPKVIARAVVAGADHNFTAPGTAAQLAAIIRDALQGVIVERGTKNEER
jgi:pimeloyl-ACP methyl ester carboxylesterase